MDRFEELNTIVKKLPLLSEKEIHDFFETFFIVAENRKVFSDEELFVLIHDIRVVLFLYMTDEEKERLCNLIINYLSGCGDMMPQMVEYCGVIYKYIPKHCCQKIFDCVFNRMRYLCASKRGIIAVTTFIKYTNKTYSTDQKKKCSLVMAYLEKLCKNDGNDLTDTLEYINNNINECFNPSKKDVLLLIPELLSGSSFLQPPLCMIKVKDDLEKKGFSVDLCDNRIYNYSIIDLIQLINKKYKYILVTSTPIDQTQNYFVDHRFIIFIKTCREIKRKGNEVCERLFVAGAHGTVNYEMLLRDVCADVIIRGEYDITAANIIDCYDKGRISEIAGNVIYNEGGEWKEWINDVICDDWDERPLDFSHIKLNNYFGYNYIKNTHVKKARWAILQASRGCPYNCTFCYNHYGKRVRYKSVDVLLNELKQLEKMDCKEVFFIDQTFTLNYEYVQLLCEGIINERINIPWQCETRVDLIDAKTISMMKKAGCKAIWLGIESFDEDVLRICKKGYQLDQLWDAFEVLNTYDMEYRAFIMVGMEGDSCATLAKTIDLVEEKRIRLSKSIIQCTPRPGTEYFEHLPDTLKEKITNYWKIDALRGYSMSDLTDVFINEMVQRLLMISNES